MLKSNRAWLPLKENKWNRSYARHLASRMGFSMKSAFVDEIERLGPKASVRRFMRNTQSMPPLKALTGMQDAGADYRSMSAADRKKNRQEAQKRNREAYIDYSMAWYDFARENGPQEKLLSFYQNIWVVSYQGVRFTADLFDYQQIIRHGMNGKYPKLCSELSTSSAMVRYLNLNKNMKTAPNENFARELLELFTLGEGNYSESDIKEAARAVTGYTFERNGRTVAFREKRHDRGEKTIFGKTDNFDLEKLLQVVFEQSAASFFVPREFCKFYLSHEVLSDELLEPLAKIWKDSGYDLGVLHETVLSSRIFYEDEFRGNMIKSPEHFYLGLLQDLDLDVAPLIRGSYRQTKQMGQEFFNPPNVSGWDGGERWINSATIAARQRTIQSLFIHYKDMKLNADEIRALEQAKRNGKGRFSVDLAARLTILGADPRKAIETLSSLIYANEDASVLEFCLAQLDARGRRLNQKQMQQLLIIALNAPAYYLC